MDLRSLSSYQYALPEELIAQTPPDARDGSRLMIIERASETISEIPFRELPDFLEKGDSVVFNDTKVIPARLEGRKETGGNVEVFLLEEKASGVWDALAKPARKLRPGTTIHFSEAFCCTVQEIFDGGVVRVEFNDREDFHDKLQINGKIPLPPYIRRDPDANDLERYQTVFARNGGAVAAPTAGLHFTKGVMERLAERGVACDFVTLHVGLGTFKPVTVEDITKHTMHRERYAVSNETAARLNARGEGRRQICVGTTCLRTLEASATADGIICAGEGATDIFIYPGYRFKYVRSLLTNFHLPGSTLLMLVSAFGGYELMMEAYKKAVKERFRFFSYGDAMLIL